MIGSFLAILLLLARMSAISVITDATGFQRLDVSDLDQIVGTVNFARNVRLLPQSIEILPRLMDRLVASPELNEFNTYFGLTFPKTTF